jgi:hypothetical protein
MTEINRQDLINLSYISLGHRCHIKIALDQNKLTNISYPFDNIISSFDGIIDCFENNFNNFFPKNIKCEMIGNRKLFRSKFFAFTHFDLDK